jgi:CHAD domain-containing protein
MKPDRINKVLRDKVKEIRKHSENIGGDFDKDTIHKFRVAVKMLRSFLRLLSTGNDEPIVKLPGKFKRMYQVAGAIRDAQLELEKLAEDEATLPVYQHKLQNDIERHKKEWDNHYSKKVIQKLKKRMSELDYVSLHPDVVASFFNDRIGSVAKTSAAKSPTNAQLHDMRKQLKDLVYTAKLFKTEWENAYAEIAKMPMKKIDGLTVRIGDYNDERLIFEHLKSFSSSKLDPVEIRAIEKICSLEEPKLKAIKKSILNSIKQVTKSLTAAG